MAREEQLRITEIFHSLQGESLSVGKPTVFVRLTGCPLRCHYCDSAYAFTGGNLLDIAEIVQQVKAFQCDHVTVTGGEPLAQPGCYPLLQQLCDLGLTVSLETSGALSIADVDPRVIKVVDLKSPASGEMHRNCLENLDLLQPHDQIKLVLCNRDDYLWAKMLIDVHQLTDRAAEVLLSPSHGQLNPAELAEWILADRLAVRLQVQLHKILWGDMPGK